ncbi:YycH family regulatory protein [Fredinandcohnia humi]
MIGMKYESIKTVVLTILVIISIVLTWSLWTYQPQYDELEKPDDLLQEVTLNNTKETHNLVKPAKILFHIEGQHFGTYDESDINKIMRFIRTWEISDLQNISFSMEKEEYLPFLKQSGHVEIHFTDRLPLQVYKTFLNINDKEHSSLEFDRIIIDVNAEDRGEGLVYFVSNKDQMIYEARINSEFIESFKKNYYPLATKNYPEQIEYQITETLSVFLPIEKTRLNRVQYYTDTIDTNSFINRLFDEPNIVKSDDLTTGEVHTDGTRLLRVYNDRKYIEFENPMITGGNKGKTTELIQTSIDFVNEHVGWTDNYRFFSWDKDAQKTVFRLYVRNFPVFNTNGLSEIIQEWGNNEIVNYIHPSVSLRIQYDTREIILPSGGTVVEELKRLPNFESEKLEYITIGYELQENQENSQFVSLQPIWCYKYNGKWMKVEIMEDGVGGNEDGLE